MGPPFKSNIDQHKKLELEYEQINANFRMLADVRFKLLALIPTLGGTAVFVLSHMGLKAEAQVSGPDMVLVIVTLVSVLGFFATLGVTIYDQRNSELYNALIHRAKYLETFFGSSRAPGGLKKVDIGGQFRERPGKNRRLFFTVGHDLGLSVIYGPVLGAWFFPFFYSVAKLICFNSTLSLILASLITMVAATFFVIWLLRLDSEDNRLYTEAASHDGLA